MENENPIILFDGVCNLCNGAVRFILKRDKTKQFRFVALQSREGKEWIDKLHIQKKTDSLIFIIGNKAFIESDAAIEISRLLTFPWNWASIFKIIPKKWRDKIYRWIAKNRYRWFGKQETVCHFDEK